MPHRLVLGGLVASAFVGVTWVAALGAGPSPSPVAKGSAPAASPDAITGGPLSVDASPLTLSVPAYPGGPPVTWGTVIRNDTGEPMTILEVTPADVEGLEVVGIGGWVPTDDVGFIATAYGWPPDGVTLTLVGGLVIPTTAEPSEISVLIGTRLPPGVTGGSVRSLLVRYRVGGVIYEDDLPWGFEMLTPTPGSPGASGPP